MKLKEWNQALCYYLKGFVGVLTPDLMVSDGGAFGRQLGSSWELGLQLQAGHANPTRAGARSWPGLFAIHSTPFCLCSLPYLPRRQSAVSHRLTLSRIPPGPQPSPHRGFLVTGAVSSEHPSSKPWVRHVLQWQPTLRETPLLQSLRSYYVGTSFPGMSVAKLEPLRQASHFCRK